jgi:hypothetical protein
LEKIVGTVSTGKSFRPFVVISKRKYSMFNSKHCCILLFVEIPFLYGSIVLLSSLQIPEIMKQTVGKL